MADYKERKEDLKEIARLYAASFKVFEESVLELIEDLTDMLEDCRETTSTLILQAGELGALHESNGNFAYQLLDARERQLVKLQESTEKHMKTIKANNNLVRQALKDDRPEYDVELIKLKNGGVMCAKNAGMLPIHLDTILCGATMVIIDELSNGSESPEQTDKE